MQSIHNLYYHINSICFLTTFISFLYSLKKLFDKIRHKEPQTPWAYKDVISIIIVFSFAYLPWFNYSVTLETIPEGVYEINVGIREVPSGEDFVLSTAEIEIKRELDYSEHEDYMGVSHTRTTQHEYVYLKSFMYHGKQYNTDQELWTKGSMHIDYGKNNESFEIEVCSDEIDLNTVGLTRADVRASKDILAKIEYYSSVAYAGIYTFILIRRKFLQAARKQA